MATQRLTDQDKQFIRGAFNNVLGRALNNKPFPYAKEEEVWDLGMSLLEPKVRDCYEYLRNDPEQGRHLVTTGWNPKLILEDETTVDGYLFEYTIVLITGELPWDGMPVLKNSVHYQPLLEWATYYCDVKHSVKIASNYVKRVVDHCTSAGQIARILDDDLLAFLPKDIRESLGYAERRSRIPRGFEVNPDEIEQLGMTLSLGSISPKDREGLRINCHRKAFDRK